ncbi:maltase A1-like [Pectinophora gossypiella]|uniref:maltase A1-like n=1 Tax=Pectinophora gossypiella TaxID=13191 RepID=UPI00214F571D|nr:maltase A1-like [Pectinophora gossypiella]
MWQLFLISLVVSVHGRYENVNIKQDWWPTAAFYQIYVRSFMDSDGDGIGDINGITSRLEYFKEIGIDALCLSPIYKSPMHDFGFDVSDYYAVHPDYGTMEDFEQLLKKASDMSIKVAMDFVPNHTSNESEWFIKSASKDEYYSDWYIWEKGHLDPSGERKPPNNWISMFRKSAWTYMPSRDQYYLHQFGSSQPDLNYRNPVVVEEIKTIIKYWLEKGVVGMRMTSINFIFEVDKDNYGGRYPDEPRTGKPGVGPEDYTYLNHVYTKDLEDTYELVSQFREVFDSISVRDNLTRVMITEAYTGIKNAVRYYGEGNHAGAHIPTNFALIEDLAKDADARDIKYTVDRWMSYKPLRKKANWATGNQDKNRIASRFRGELVDAFNMLVLLLPGIAITYMGEEIGMVNGFVPWSETKDPLACNTDDPVNFIEVSRDPVRTPFQWSPSKNAGFSNAEITWLPVADGSDVINVATQRSAVRSHYQVFRTLTGLRTRPAFKFGRYESLALSNEVFAFKRWYNDDTYVVVLNVGKTYRVVNLTAFDLVFGQLEVEASSVLSSRTFSDNVQANYLDLAADEALVLRMQV